MLDGAAIVDVLEKVINALLLHEAADEVEIRFAILNAMIHVAVSCQSATA